MVMKLFVNLDLIGWGGFKEMSEPGFGEIRDI
jgi:hypothetical protein